MALHINLEIATVKTIKNSSGSITSFAGSTSVETPYFHVDGYTDGLLVSLNEPASLGASAKKPEPLRLEIPVTCSASASVYTTTLMPTPGPFGIYTITTTKTETIPLTTTTTTATTTKTITTDGFDFFGQRKTTTLFNTTTVFNNFTMTQTDTSSTTIISMKPAAPATPTTQYITVTPSKEFITVTSTQSKETVTITATPSKEFITVIATPSKETVTVNAAPSKEYVTVTASLQTITTTVTSTKAAAAGGGGGIFDGLFGTQTTASGTVASSFCSNAIVTVTSTASRECVTVAASPQTLTTTATTTKTAGGIFDGNIIGGGTTKTITLNNTVTRSEVSRVTVTSTQPFTLTETITTSCPLPPLPIQTTLPSLSLPDTMNILRVILKVIQALQGDKPQFNPVVELIKTVIQQAIKQDDEKNVQAILSFVFDLIQKNSPQTNNNQLFPFMNRLLMKEDFEAEAREWFTNQFIGII
ncbi:hypothetical protein PS6_007312 [Mucor atramentarius]